jgi:hypothetical protein
VRLTQARTALLATVILAGVVAACELVLPTHGVDSSGALGPDAGDGELDADLCAHAYPPGKPLDGGDGTEELLFAVQSMGFAQDAGPAVGYDLDRTCTCQPGQGPSCTPPIPSAVEGALCDGPGGRDVAGTAALGDLLEAALVQTPLGDVNQRIQAGYLSYLIQVKHYRRGGPASHVFVSMYNSSGLLVADDAGKGIRQVPSWDGGEEWALDCALSMATGCPNSGPVGDAAVIPGYFDTDAYVTSDNVAVAHISPLVISVGLTTLRFTDVVVTAKITTAPDGTPTRLDGQIAGRFALRDIFQTLATMKDGFGGYLCGGSTSYQTFRHKVCQDLDIASDPANDSRGGTCDAMSMAMPFTAVPARMGLRVDHPPVPPGCEAAVDCSE